MDAIQFFMTRHGAAHAEAAGLFTGLTDDQIRSCPHPAVNSIAWLLWHIARVEDVAINRLVARRPMVIHEIDWLARLKVTRRDVGTAMTDEEVSDLSARIDLGGLRDYWHAVGERTVAVLRDVRPDDLDEVNDAEYVRRMCDDDAIFSDAAAGVVDVLSNKSKGQMLSQLGLSHHFGHIGEARVTRTLLLQGVR